MAICESCSRELSDPANRRYRYPFITCTDCGPRFTVIEAMPYDRERTTMRAFTQCSACLREYTTPGDRRYHSETNSCPECGPAVWLELTGSVSPVAMGDSALRRTAERIPALEMRIETGEKENRRQFERAPYGLCECTREGALVRVNHALARMLGYRSGADLRDKDVADAVFESGADLRWLVDRAVRTAKVEAVETTLKTRDHRLLSVRLHALSSDGPIVIAVEDLTKLAAIENRLREAHRRVGTGAGSGVETDLARALGKECRKRVVLRRSGGRIDD